MITTTDAAGNITGNLDMSVVEIPLSFLAKSGHGGCNGRGVLEMRKTTDPKELPVLKPCRCVLNSIRRWEEKGFRVKPVNG